MKYSDISARIQDFVTKDKIGFGDILALWALFILDLVVGIWEPSDV